MSGNHACSTQACSTHACKGWKWEWEKVPVPPILGTCHVGRACLPKTVVCLVGNAMPSLYSMVARLSPVMHCLILSLQPQPACPAQSPPVLFTTVRLSPFLVTPARNVLCAHARCQHASLPCRSMGKSPPSSSLPPARCWSGRRNAAGL